VKTATLGSTLMETEEILSDHRENYFIPMSDLLAGVVFVLLILIMSLALVIRPDFVASERATAEMKRIAAELEKARALERQFIEPREAASRALEMILDRMSMALASTGLPNVLNNHTGSIEMSGRLFFGEGEHVLSETGRARADQLALILSQYLGCVSNIPRPLPELCTGIPDARLSRVIVASHVGPLDKRMNGVPTAAVLTAARALGIYSRLAEKAPILMQLQDPHGQPGVEFRGFGDRQPKLDQTRTAPLASDRIELILSMDVPAIPDDVWRLPVVVPPQ
jgi:hypothetical protein